MTQEDFERFDRINRPVRRQMRIAELKEKLKNDYDYIGIKIAMGIATREEYADKIAESEEIREEIRRLEDEQDVLG